MDERGKGNEGSAYGCLNAALDAQKREEVYAEWRANRRAVVHTLDISGKHSSHAKITVRNFRQGMYFSNVDFHVGSINNYISGRLAETFEPFFDHAILDLPDTHAFMEVVGKALKPNGKLITFCPSITQINACLLLVKEKKLPFFMESVLETGSAIGVGGREWDVRLVKPRATLKPDTNVEGQAHHAVNEGVDSADVQLKSAIAGSSDLSETVSTSIAPPAILGLELVCRPKVGGRVTGGGFLGVWRRKV